MAIRIVQLGSPREVGEGIRLGTVRRPPRGIRKSDYAARNFYDVWLPLLSPSAQLLKQWQATEDKSDITAFRKKFQREMRAPEASRLLDLLAALSHQTDLALGCYCKDEARCHRLVLRQLLSERGASVRP